MIADNGAQEQLPQTHPFPVAELAVAFAFPDRGHRDHAGARCRYLGRACRAGDPDFDHHRPSGPTDAPLGP